MKEIHKKTDAISEKSKGTHFEYEGTTVSQAGQALSLVRDSVALNKRIITMESALIAICNKMPNREKEECCGLIKQEKNAHIIEDKLPLMSMILSKISSQMDSIIHYTGHSSKIQLCSK